MPKQIEETEDPGEKQQLQEIHEEMKQCITELEDLKHKISDFQNTDYTNCLNEYHGEAATEKSRVEEHPYNMLRLCFKYKKRILELHERLELLKRQMIKVRATWSVLAPKLTKKPAAPPQKDQSHHSDADAEHRPVKTPEPPSPTN